MKLEFEIENCPICGSEPIQEDMGDTYKCSCPKCKGEGIETISAKEYHNEIGAWGYWGKCINDKKEKMTFPEAVSLIYKMAQDETVCVYATDEAVERSRYVPKEKAIYIGTQFFGDYRDYAILAEETAHYLQDKNGDWCLKMAQGWFMPSVFGYFAERSAKNRAKFILLQIINDFGLYYICWDYLDSTLLKYRKKTFGL